MKNNIWFLAQLKVGQSSIPFWKCYSGKCPEEKQLPWRRDFHPDTIDEVYEIFAGKSPVVKRKGNHWVSIVLLSSWMHLTEPSEIHCKSVQALLSCLHSGLFIAMVSEWSRRQMIGMIVSEIVFRHDSQPTLTLTREWGTCYNLVCSNKQFHFNLRFHEEIACGIYF